MIYNPKTAIKDIVEVDKRKYCVSSRDMIDTGCETMIFLCDKDGNINGVLKDFEEHHATPKEMRIRHAEIVANIEQYVK